MRKPARKKANGRRMPANRTTDTPLLYLRGTSVEKDSKELLSYRTHDGAHGHLIAQHSHG